MSHKSPQPQSQSTTPAVRPYENVTVRLRPARNTGQLQKIAEVVLAAQAERKAS